MSVVVTAQQIESFDRDGAVVIAGLFAEWVCGMHPGQRLREAWFPVVWPR